MYKNQGPKLHYSTAILQRWLVSMVATGCLLACQASAAPEGAKVELGDVAIHDEGSSAVMVEQFSDRALINWENFDTQKDESITFKQPGASSIAVNVIHGGQPTKFNGTLEANGQIVLINSNGIVFGKTARLDVAALIATTLDLDHESLSEKGVLHFKADENFDAKAKIENKGVITAREAGLIGFVAPSVQNSGVIEATLGTVHLASGDEFTIDMAGDGLVSLSLNQDLKKQLVSNSGEINAKGGKIYLTAAVGKEIIDEVINMDGIANADVVEMRQGVIHVEFKKGESEPVKDEGEAATPPVIDEPPVTETPIIEAPPAEEPVIEAPVVEEPVITEPVELALDSAAPSAPLSQGKDVKHALLVGWLSNGIRIKDIMTSWLTADYSSHFVQSELVELRKKTEE